jgi:hypothetical protein
MNHIEAIEVGISAKLSYQEIARKIYLTYPTMAFVGAEEAQYGVLSEISGFFKVPICCIQVAGSAKTGRSFHKRQSFLPGVSDLDIAIVDSQLFVRYMEFVFEQSRGYADLTSFPVRRGVSTHAEYVRCITRGIFRPDLMTVGPERAAWNNFFTRLSDKHTQLFRSINASVYLSESFFESKQRSAIKQFAESRPL